MASKDTLTALVQEVSRILNVKEVDPDIGLAELGIDSMNAAELALVCDQLYPGADTERLPIGEYMSLRELDQALTQAAQ
jgi:hypothetical protein